MSGSCTAQLNPLHIQQTNAVRVNTFGKRCGCWRAQCYSAKANRLTAPFYTKTANRIRPDFALKPTLFLLPPNALEKLPLRSLPSLEDGVYRDKTAGKPFCTAARLPARVAYKDIVMKQNKTLNSLQILLLGTDAIALNTSTLADLIKEFQRCVLSLDKSRLISI
jgi:hypothetical protein